MKNKTFRVGLFILLLAQSVFIRADIHQAASCSQADVQAAVNAAADGDTVLVPAGEETWTTRVLIDKKAISVIGAGKGNTVIIDHTGLSVGEDPTMSLVTVTSELGKLVRLSGFTFREINAPCAVLINGTGREWRIDNCEFLSDTFTSAITALGYIYGVVDHCRFLNSRAGVTKDWGGWNRPASFGTADAVYLENCESKGTVHCNTLDAGYGSRYVYRYNYIENTYIESHGTNHQPGVFSYEIYNNVFEKKPAGYPQYHYMYLRGGTGVVFNNTALQGDTTWGWIRANQESSCEIPGYQVTCFSYPCPGQIGRTHDYNGDGVQDLVPLYSWNNSREGEYRGIIPNGNPPQPCVTDYVREGRDYFNNTPKPGYVPYPYPHPLTVLGETGRLLNLQATPSGSTLVLSWQPVLEAVSYHVVRDWQNDQAVIVTGTSWTDPTPAAGRIYMVYALNSTGKVLAAEGKVIHVFPQSIALAPGWNWVSFNVMPMDLSLDSTFSGILAQVEQVKTQNQSAIRSSNTWKGDLADMSGIGSYKMYKVKVSGNCTLTVTGTAISPTSSISLQTGWNWAAYLPTTAIPIATALDSIKGQVQEVKSLTQSATYNGTSWSGTLTQLEPGQGYAIKMSGQGNLIYAEEQ